MNLLVSIIINCYNSEKYISQAIESVLNQTYSNWELICFDNKSNDNTVNIVNSYNDGRIKLHINELNENLSIARNKAFSKAKGDLVAFLDSDDIWLPQKLFEQVNVFKKNSNLGLVYTDAYYFRDGIKNQMQLYKYRRHYIGFCFEKILIDYFLCISTCMVNKKLFQDKQIEFDDSLTVCEDLDFFIKISLLYEFDYVDIPLVKYRLHDNSLTYSQSKLFIIERDIIASKLENNKIIIENHLKTLSKFKYLNKIEEIKYYWKIGLGKKSRILIKQLKPLNLKLLILWIFSYVSFKNIEKILHILKPKRIGY